MKKRLDDLLIDMGFFENISTARSYIMAGKVIVNEKKIDKAGTILKNDDKLSIKVKGLDLKYVSRGGLKLEKAIRVFNLDFENRIVLDVGSSTGGFTDCSLQHGAKFVYAVDVGTNQLDWSLRTNKSVKSLENMHIKNLSNEDIDNSQIDYIVMDVSFISVKSIFPYLKSFCSAASKLVVLIKPQFEVKKELISKGGIVKDLKDHELIIREVINSASNSGLYLEKFDISPIKGTKGNIEYLSLFSTDKADTNLKFSLETFIDRLKMGE